MEVVIQVGFGVPVVLVIIVGVIHNKQRLLLLPT